MKKKKPVARKTNAGKRSRRRNPKDGDARSVGSFFVTRTYDEGGKQIRYSAWMPTDGMHRDKKRLSNPDAAEMPYGRVGSHELGFGDEERVAYNLILIAFPDAKGKEDHGCILVAAVPAE